jgi:hypothetical protein
MTIRLSQVLLAVALVFFMVYIYKLRSVLRDRLIYFVSAVVGLTLVFWPDLASRLANLLGIGRGTDLLLYLFIMTFLFYSVGVNAELRKMRQEIARLVREIALLDASRQEVKLPNKAGENGVSPD